MAATVDHITVVTNNPEVPWGPGVLSVLPVTGTNCAVSVVLCADLEPALSIIHHARTHWLSCETDHQHGLCRGLCP